MNNPRMTLDDVLVEMRSRGMKIHKKTLSDSIRDGVFPFGHILSVGQSGRANIMILRSEFESWARTNL